MRLLSDYVYRLLVDRCEDLGYATAGLSVFGGKSLTEEENAKKPYLGLHTD